MTIEERVGRLERENRRLRRGMCAVAVGGLALLVMGQAAPPGRFDRVVAKRVTVVDRAGKPVVEMFPYGLQILDAKGKSVLRLRRGQGGGNLLIDNDGGQTALSLGVNYRTKNGRIYVSSAAGKMAASLAVDRRGAGSLVLYGADQDPRLVAGVGSRRGTGGIAAYGAGNKRLRTWP